MQKIVLTFMFLTSIFAYATGGFYAGIGAGYANISNTPLSGFNFNNGATSSQNTGAPALAFYGGYNFNRYIGVQVDYDFSFSTPIGGSYNTTNQLIDALAIVYLPFGIFTNSLSGFSLFVKGGIGYNDFKFSNVNPTCSTCINPPGEGYGIIPVYGIGAEYNFNPVGIRLEWVGDNNITIPNLGYNQVQANSNMYLLSVLYHF